MWARCGARVSHQGGYWWAGRESNPHSRRRLIYSQRSSPPAHPTHGGHRVPRERARMVKRGRNAASSSLGADDGTRTRNRRFTKPLLYQLSYVGATGEFTARGRGRAIRCTRPVPPLHLDADRGEVLGRGEVAERLVRPDRVVGGLPRPQLGLERAEIGLGVGDLVELLGVGPVGALEGAPALHYVACCELLERIPPRERADVERVELDEVARTDDRPAGRLAHGIGAGPAPLPGAGPPG